MFVAKRLGTQLVNVGHAVEGESTSVYCRLTIFLFH